MHYLKALSPECSDRIMKANHAANLRHRYVPRTFRRTLLVGKGMLPSAASDT